MQGEKKKNDALNGELINIEPNTIFYGPPGTGKTLLAKAVASSFVWAVVMRSTRPARCSSSSAIFIFHSSIWPGHDAPALSKPTSPDVSEVSGCAVASDAVSTVAASAAAIW